MLEKFHQHARHNGRKVAVLYLGESLSYEELSLRVDQLANYLVLNGVTNDTTVGLCLERGIDAIVGLLAVLKVGATYIPLDPAYPRDRLEFMMQETSPACILTNSQALKHIPSARTRAICIDLEAEAIRHCQHQVLPPCYHPETLAYIMYTSGSTGKPKGVQVSRRSVDFYLNAISDLLSIQPEDVYLHTASFSFSSSVRQLLVPLNAGATIALASQDQAKDPMSLLKLMKDNNVTVSDTVASVWRAVLQAVKALDTETSNDLLTNSLRLVLLSGELTSCSLLQQIRKNLKNCPAIFNIYGQTETIGVCAYQVPENFDEEHGYVPVGFPYNHNRIYILDTAMQPVPQGEIGELYVSGGCLSKGYIDRPDMTAKQFMPNPWAGHCPEANDLFSRLYRTGDLARQLPDGRLEIKGRIDFQIKLRGMRVELGEIEQAIETCSLAKEAIVLAKLDSSHEQRLVAYVVPQAEVSDKSPKKFATLLKQELKRSLPDYLIPSLIEKLDALPRTPNGKRDRLSLPQPDWSRLSTGSADQKPQDEIETALLKIWTELLGFAPGLKDDFFDLGGHSLLAVQLFAQLDNRFGCKLSFNHLLEYSTISQLSEYIRLGHTENKSTILIPLQKEGNKPPLFCIHGIGGSTLYYRSILPYLSPDQPVYGMQSQGFDGIQEPLTTVENMARCYLKEIRQVYPTGPIYLLGHSFGGLIAYEMARQIEHNDESLGLLAIIDTKTPRLAKIRPTIENFLLALVHNLWYMPGNERLMYLIKTVEWFQKKRKLASDREYAEHLKQKNANLRMFNVLQPNYKAQETYEPALYQGKMIIFRAIIQSPRSFREKTLGWQSLVEGGIDVHAIPGNHLSVMEEPNVGYLAKILASYLERLEKKEMVSVR